MIFLAGKYQIMIMTNKDASTKIVKFMTPRLRVLVMAGLFKAIELERINYLQINVSTSGESQTNEVTVIMSKGATLKIVKIMTPGPRVLVL